MTQKTKDYEPTEKERGQLIAALVAARKRADLDQKQLSRALGKTDTFATKVENGYQEISFWQVVAWAKATGTPAKELLLQAVR